MEVINSFTGNAGGAADEVDGEDDVDEDGAVEMTMVAGEDGEADGGAAGTSGEANGRGDGS